MGKRELQDSAFQGKETTFPPLQHLSLGTRLIVSTMIFEKEKFLLNLIFPNFSLIALVYRQQKEKSSHGFIVIILASN